MIPDSDAIGARSCMDTYPLWLETLERERAVLGSDDGCEDQEMVVGCQQLEVASGHEA